MTITLHLPADLEGPLLDEAAEQGRDLQDAIVALLRNNFGAGSSKPALHDLPYSEWKKGMDEWQARVEARADRYPLGHVTDVSRESIYEGCGE